MSALLLSHVTSAALVKRALRLVLDQEEEDVGRESIFSVEKLCLVGSGIELNQSINQHVMF